MKWRDARPEDKEAIDGVQRQMNKRMGVEFDAPDMNSPSVLWSMVAENGTGVLGGFCIEAVAELKFAAVDPRVVARGRKQFWEQFCADTRKQGVRYVQVPVPSIDTPEMTRIREALVELGMYRSPCDFFIKDLNQ